MSRIAVAVVLLTVLFSIACGGGNSNSGSSATPPVFSLSAPGAASEGASFTYTVQASDPNGGRVTFALVSAPVGATISGTTINWTPTHAQSRRANAFTVRATSSSGGTATTSFSVTPAGTIQGTDVSTNWTSAGKTDRPMILSNLAGIQALVPDGKGGYTTYSGSGGIGTFSIPNVPAGYFWLQLGAEMYWTNSNDMDLGSDTSSAVIVPGPSEHITGNVNLDGLDPWEDGTSTAEINGLQAIIPTRGTGPAFGGISFTNLTSITAAATTFTGQLPMIAHPMDPSKGDLTYLLQTERSTGSSQWTQFRVLKATGPLPLYVDSTTTSLNIAATLTADNPSSVYMGARSAGFNSSVAPSNPNASARAADGFRAGVYNVFSDRNTTANGAGLYSFAIVGGFLIPSLVPSPMLTTPGIPLASVTYSTQLASDLNVGEINFVSPFSSFGKTVYSAEQQTAVSAFQSGTETFYTIAATGYSTTTAPSATSPFDVPLLNVQNPKIDGADLFQATTAVAPVTLSWDPPQLGSPNGYVVTATGYDPSATCPPPPPGLTSGFCPAMISTHRFTTPTTSITIPSGVLTSGVSYVFTIRAISDGGTDFLKAPNRGSWDRAYSDVISNTIVVGNPSSN